MIRHDNPNQRVAESFLLAGFQRLYNGTPRPEIGKQGLPPMRTKGDKVDSALLRNTPFSQAVLMARMKHFLSLPGDDNWFFQCSDLIFPGKAGSHSTLPIFPILLWDLTCQGQFLTKLSPNSRVPHKL